MKGTWVIAKRELNSFFDSLMAYIMMVLFLGFTGFFTWLYGADIFYVGQASLGSFFSISYWTLFFFIPALTMRLIAEEKKTGTIELLLTKPVTDWEIVTGKFLSVLILIAITLSFSLIYYISVSRLGSIDHGAVWTGYLGLLLMSAAYISIGIFASSITNNQIVSFLLSLLIGIFLHFIFGMLSSNFTGLSGKILNYLSVQSHFDSISRGVIDFSDIVFFLSLAFLGLIGTELMLAKRNVSE
jgi:ABC-2 type transport system permease protein